MKELFVRVTWKTDGLLFIVGLEQAGVFKPVCYVKNAECAGVICDVLQGAVELQYGVSRFDYTKSFENGMKNASAIVEGERLIRLFDNLE